MSKWVKRVLSMLLVCMLVGGAVPVGAVADNPVTTAEANTLEGLIPVKINPNGSVQVQSFTTQSTDPQVVLHYWWSADGNQGSELGRIVPDPDEIVVGTRFWVNYELLEWQEGWDWNSRWTYYNFDEPWNLPYIDKLYSLSYTVSLMLKRPNGSVLTSGTFQNDKNFISFVPDTAGHHNVIIDSTLGISGDKGVVVHEVGYAPQNKLVSFWNNKLINAVSQTSVNFRDNLFNRDSSSYHHDIAQASMALSAASYHEDYLRAALENEMGFEDVYYDYDDKGLAIDEYAIGHKLIANGGKQYELVIIVIQGTDGYFEENFHNFTFAYFGFDAARAVIQSKLNAYLSSYVNSGHEKKILITGHSRGGAIANLLGRTLNDGGAFSKKNIFVYTFATPNTTTQAAASARKSAITDNNIFNIVNPRDTVTGVPPTIGFAGLGNWKYGRTLALQSKDKLSGSATKYSEYRPKLIHELEMLADGRPFIQDVNAFINQNAWLSFHGLGLNNHNATVYMAWMNITPPVEYAIEAVGKYAIIQCPVDVEVYQNGTLVGKIVNNTIDETLAGDAGLYVFDDVKYIQMSSDSYSLKLTGTATGIMDYAVYDVNELTGEVLDEKEWTNVALTSGKTMTSSVSGNIDAEDTQLYAVGGNGAPKEIIVDGTEIPLVSGSQKTGDDGITNWDFIAPVTHLTQVPIGYIAIRTPQDLDSIRNINVVGNSTYGTLIQGNYILMNDIDMSSYGDFEPIGSSGSPRSEPFNGIFDGNGYKIKNLTVNVDYTEIDDPLYGDAYAGLFGSVAAGAYIRNLGIENCNVTAIHQLSNAYAGAIVGNGSRIINSYSSGAVTAISNKTAYAGGMAGGTTLVYGFIENCYSSSFVRADGQSGGYAGGITGRAGSVQDRGINKCFNVGNVESSWSAGGITGDTNGSTVNCYNLGTVSRRGVTGLYVAGAGGISASGMGVSTSYNAGQISSNASHYLGGIVGYNSGGSPSNCFYVNTVNSGVGSWDGSPATFPTVNALSFAQMKQQNSFTGFNFDTVWMMPESAGYPILKPQSVDVVYPNPPRPLALDVAQTVVNTAGGGHIEYFSFTPITSDTYEFFSTSSLDTVGRLCDVNWKLLLLDDDSGEGRNFLVSYFLTAGTTYYFGSASPNGTYTVMLKKAGTTPATYAVIVNSGSGSGSYLAGATVTITAGTPPAGQQFKNWTVNSGGVTLADANSASTTFTMPANAVTVTANFVTTTPNTYLVTVNSGTGSGNYTAGATVSITASGAPSGKVFDKWTTVDGVTFANANAASTSFTMPVKNVMVTATYKDATTNPPANKDALNSRINAIGNTQKGNYTDASWNAFQTALSNARDVVNNASATQDQVNAALNALNSAYNGLRENKGIFGTNPKWYGAWWHYILFFVCFGFIWMWF